MQRADGSVLLGGLREEMKDNDFAALPITIRYRNGKGHNYKTTFRITRDVRMHLGLGVEGVSHGRDWFGFLRFKGRAKSMRSEIEGNGMKKPRSNVGRSYKVIRREEGKPDALIFLPHDASKPDAVRVCEEDGYRVIDHEITDTPHDKKHIATIVVIVEPKA